MFSTPHRGSAGYFDHTGLSGTRKLTTRMSRRHFAELRETPAKTAFEEMSRAIRIGTA